MALLGIPTVEELLARIPGHDLSEWEEFWTLEPFGPRHDDFRSAIIAKTLYDVNRDKDSPNLGLDSFIPTYVPQETAVQRRNKQRMVLEKFASMPGVKIIRRSKWQK
jgi:hypothetical protein